MKKPEIMDAEFEDLPDEKPLVDQIKDGISTAAKFFEHTKPEIAEALRNAEKEVDNVKATAQEAVEIASTGKKLYDQVSSFMKKVSEARGSLEIKREF